MTSLSRFLTALAVVLLTGCAAPPPSPPAEPMADAAPLVPDVYSGVLAPLAAGDVPGRGRVASLAPPQDLWERIRMGFAMPDLQGALVADRERWYTKRPEAMQRMAQRSRKYIFHIVEEIERRGMPMELALLPYVESAFNPVAVSSAKAAGIWQFMPATGNHFSLKQNAFRDDRRDVLASTRAALDYLQMLHRAFGDWHLALAAYNWGQGNVSKAQRASRKAGKGDRYGDLKLPRETQLYVPKLQALKNIVLNPQAFGTELPDIPNHPYFQVVDIDRDIDTELVARLADIRLEDFQTLNPSLNKPVILAAGTPHILLPWDNAGIFRRNLQAYNQGRTASWTVWVAPHTMSVAEAAKRTGMEEGELRRANHIPPRVQIKAGAALMVPRSEAHTQDVPVRIADSAYLLVAPESVPGMRRSSVKVRAGDTLSRVARRHRVSVANLARWNGLKSTARLRAGQSLHIYTPVRVKAGSPRAASAPDRTKTRATKAGSAKQTTPRTATPKARSRGSAKKAAGRPVPKRRAKGQSGKPAS